MSIDDAQPDPSRPDTRSPIERFRTKPKKALSVTDLVSPAWCELQYFYSLSKHGKKRATPAMNRGTKVHKKLEDEVHTNVPVSVTTKEDSWGLKIWNTIQGLRTLRETGRTREFHVWGVIEGEIVNGIIDELSYKCPDPEREAQRPAKDGSAETQSSITDYMPSSVTVGGTGKAFSQLGTSIENRMEPVSKEQQGGHRKIYITDIKTRVARSLPSAVAARPTEIQLQLYHSMLTSLAQGQVPLTMFADRYDFDPTAPFSDSFIAEVGSLNEPPFSDATTTTTTDAAASSQDPIDLLLKHNTIQSLWGLMTSQFREHPPTRPPPAAPRSSPPATCIRPPAPTSATGPSPTRPPTYRPTSPTAWPGGAASGRPAASTSTRPAPSAGPVSSWTGVRGSVIGRGRLGSGRRSRSLRRSGGFWLCEYVYFYVYRAWCLRQTETGGTEELMNSYVPCIYSSIIYFAFQEEGRT